MQQYETTFIVTPVLTETELKNILSGYVTFLKNNDAEIIEESFWGLRQLAYPINKKTSGFYFTVEYKADTNLVDKLELTLKRDDENILRWLTIKLDKFSIDYNDRKRKGLVGRKKKEQKEQKAEA
ncbi:MAG: 30S ribosomal protein S6 [Chitinophagales bacterium]|nr:30S ribosomal protein S6 [Chitinophagales bacterium]